MELLKSIEEKLDLRKVARELQTILAFQDTFLSDRWVRFWWSGKFGVMVIVTLDLVAGYDVVFRPGDKSIPADSIPLYVESVFEAHAQATRVSDWLGNRGVPRRR